MGHVVPLQPCIGFIYCPLSKYSPSELTKIKRRVADFIAKGHVEPNSSLVGVLMLFVQKKDGGLRCVWDYCALNKATIANRCPLPGIDDLLDHLHGALHFTSLDLQSGYRQIKMIPLMLKRLHSKHPMDCINSRC